MSGSHQRSVEPLSRASVFEQKRQQHWKTTGTGCDGIIRFFASFAKLRAAGCTARMAARFGREFRVVNNGERANIGIDVVPMALAILLLVSIAFMESVRQTGAMNELLAQLEVRTQFWMP